MNPRDAKEIDMSAGDRVATESADRVLVMTRIFNAPRSLVFKAWTDPEHLMRWWGPHGFTVVSCEMDLRPGGGWHVRMRAPNGREDRQRGVYREIVEPERLAFTYAFEDATGNRGHETLVTVTFDDQGGKTRVTVHQAVFESSAMCDDHVRGWGEALERLAEFVAKT
jgi:uncharacterized protein YndB with AHSA1/START domain